MSNVSNRHAFAILNKDSKPFTGQRLARVIAKADKSGNYPDNLTESRCVSIPPIMDSEIEKNIQKLYPHISRMLADVQDKIIRELRIDTGCTEIADSAISVMACIEYLESDATGNRVTKEMLESWFTEDYTEIAGEYIARAMSFDPDSLTDNQLEQVGKKINVLRDMFAGFSSGKYSPDDAKIKALKKFISFAGEIAENDPRMQAINTRMDKIVAKRAEDMSTNALGF